MPDRAPRLLLRSWLGHIRSALRALYFSVAAMVCSTAYAQQIETARFIAPTTHYAHGVLGDAVEYSGMMIRLSNGVSYLVGFTERGRVFEDIAPRLWDVTGDGEPEAVVIETDPRQGAQLAVYGLRNGDITKVASTPHIGQTYRWLAPIGAVDLDGDGRIEIAYIDRPHLAKTLRIWRYRNGKLIHVADQPGLTNHKIGWDHIPGGIRRCNNNPEVITASYDWRRITASTLENGKIRTRDIGPYTGPNSLNTALNCP